MKKVHIKKLLLATVATVSVLSCTDLEIEGTDSIISDSAAEFSGVADVTGSLDNLYNGINRIGGQRTYYALQEITTDELLVPTRGTDWGDNGVWRTLHNHTWDPAHQDILGAWNNWNTSIFQANEIIDPLSGGSTAQVAQAKFARAYAMWIIMDSFGQVPFRETNEGPEIDPTILTRTEALAFVLSDLDDAIADLPTTIAMDMDNLNRGSKAAARFLKARVLLNAHVYDGSGIADPSNMNEVISLVDAIATDGFALEEGYFDIFKAEADTETIWWVPAGIGNRIWNGMHYNVGAPGQEGGGWNGFSTLAEFYDIFEGDANTNAVGSGQEERRGFMPDATNADETNLGIAYGFLLGQQYTREGDKVKDNSGEDLVYTRDFPGLVGNSDATGIRTIKYHPVNGAFTPHQLLFRYADAHLMKAEAMLRSGGDATAEVNELRVLRNAAPFGSVSEQNLIDERGRELYIEIIRRTDLIRFGQFTKDWEFKDAGAIGDVNKNLFPIPINALLSNPNLVQNPGY